MNLLPIIYALLCASTVATRAHSDLNDKLKKAARYGNARRVQALLANPRVDPATGNNYAIGIASDIGYTKCVRLLLADKRVNPADYDNYAIRRAAQNGHTECVRLLLAHERVNPAAQDNWAIRKAAENGHTECVELLLAGPRVNPAVWKSDSICQAAQKGHTECVGLLFADGRANPAEHNNYAIRIATQEDHMGCVKVLLADPRVNPSAVQQNYSGSVCSLIGAIQKCKDGDLVAFKQMDPTTLANDVLNILISRNRLFPRVLHFLLPAWLARLNIPDTLCDNTAYKDLLHLALPGGLCSPSQLRELTNTFTCFKNLLAAFSDLAAAIVAHAYGLVS